MKIYESNLISKKNISWDKTKDYKPTIRCTLLDRVKTREGLLVHQKKNEYLSSMMQGMILDTRLCQNLEDRWCYGDLRKGSNFYSVDDYNMLPDDTEIKC